MNLEIKDCRWPWNRLYVHVNGDIKPCCYSLFDVGKVGTAKDMKAVWTGKEMTELRDAVSKNKLHRICAGAGCAYVQSKIPDELVRTQAKYRDTIPDGLVDPVTKKLALLDYGPSALAVAHGFYARKQLFQCVIWAERAAKSGHLAAMHWLGTQYALWRGRFFTQSRGLHYLKLAAELRNPESVRVLGYYHHRKRNHQKALACFQDGVSLNDSDSFFWLSHYHEYGIVLEKNAAEANRLLKLAASRGSAAAIKRISKQKETFGQP